MGKHGMFYNCIWSWKSSELNGKGWSLVNILENCNTSRVFCGTIAGLWNASDICTYSILQVKYSKKQDLLMSMNYSSWCGFSCMLMCMDLNMLFLTAPGAVYSSPFSHTPQIILRSNRIWESTFGFHPTYPSCHIYWWVVFPLHQENGWGLV